jgi:hypothetical protein
MPQYIAQVADLAPRQFRADPLQRNPGFTRGLAYPFEASFNRVACSGVNLQTGLVQAYDVRFD